MYNKIKLGKYRTWDVTLYLLGVFQDKYINYQLLSVSIWRAGRMFALFAENLLSSVMVRLGILYSGLPKAFPVIPFNRPLSL